MHITRKRETRVPDKEITVRRERVIVERFDPAGNVWNPADTPPDAAPAAVRRPPDTTG